MPDVHKNARPWSDCISAALPASSNRPMKIIVVGPGAIGSLLGGLLRLEGHEVAFVGRKGAVVIPPHGLRIALAHGWHTATGFLTVAPPQPDLVMVALARHHLAQVKQGGLPLPPGIPTIFWNCDPRALESSKAPPKGSGGAWSVALTLLYAVRMQDDGVELLSDEPTLVVEKRSGAGPVLRGLARHGLNVHQVENMRPYHDSFFVARLVELPAAMCGTTVGHFLSFPEGRELAASVLSEGVVTMERSGRGLARLPVGDPRQLLEKLARKPADFDAWRDRPDRAYSPILQAFLRERPHEARELNKRVVEMASAVGLPAGWNWRLYQKAGRVASVGFFRDPAELLQSI